MSAMTKIECPSRSDVRQGGDDRCVASHREREWATCTARAVEWGRGLPVLQGTCEFCVQSPANKATVLGSLDQQMARRGHVYGEPPRSTLVELFPVKYRRIEPRLTDWAVGILTAPRKDGQDYLPRTVAAVRAAGWPDPMVFAEPGVPEPGGVRWHRWPYKMGCWGAGRGALSIMHGASENRNVGAFLLLEDDVELCLGLRAYLDGHVLWPPGHLGGLNLFLSSRDAAGDSGWFPVYNPWGGQALLFSRESLTAFLGDKLSAIQKYDHDEPHGGHGNISGTDIAVQRWSNRTGRMWWIARGAGGASLAAHRGWMSSIWPDQAQLVDDRLERAWAGDLIGAPAKAPGGPQARREEATDLAAARLASCGSCRLWDGLRCTCRNKPPSVVIDVATIGRPELYCPIGNWQD